MAEQSSELARRIRQINAATDAARGQSYSPDGTVFLEVNTLGAITSIWLAEHAGERGMDTLANNVIRTYEKARAAAMTEGERVYERMMHGAGDRL